MVLTTYRKKGIRLSHLWFATQEQIIDLQSSRKGQTDLVYVHGTKIAPPEGCGGWVKLSELHSLIKQINGSEDEIWMTYGKHLKAYIKRSQREGSTVRIFRGREIDAELLDSCASFYEQMKAAKGIPDLFNRNLAERYAEDDALVISMAYVNGTPVGFNAYIADATHFRAWLTAFAFREEEFDAQAVSRAHQLLEWETMRYCCRNGITSYDFGGIASFEEPNGIDKFKMTFAREGERVTYDNYLVGVSAIGKIAVLGFRLLKKIRR